VVWDKRYAWNSALFNSCTHFDRGTAQFYDPAKAKTISLSPDQFRGDFKAIHFPK